MSTVVYYVPSQSNGNPTMSMELRNSSGCAARWTRWTNDSWNCCHSTMLKVERQLWTTYAWYTTHTDIRTVYDSNTGRYWTPMVQNTSSDRHRSCYGSTCTSWYT